MSDDHGHIADERALGRNPIERIAAGAVHVAAILLQLAAVALVVNAVYRYTVGGGFPIIAESSRFALLLVVFLGLAGTHVVGGHVRVELLLQALPKRLQSLLTDFLVPLVSILFLGLLGWSGWVATAQMFALGTTTPSRPAILLWPIAAVVPAGCVLLILLLVLNLVRRFRSRN
jgi:TRAP-type C4-dicarboxylate transport system permease small subunit